MKFEELDELHYITPIKNMGSICTMGILSHKKAEKIPHQSVAMDEIQERRKKVVVPGGRPLHQYVNLYFHARRYCQVFYANSLKGIIVNGFHGY